MDGRVDLSAITKVPLGIMQSLRNLGGRFDLGWPFFQSILWQWYQYAEGMERDCVIVATYHFSRGDIHRGCRGFDYRKDEAMYAARTLKLQCESAFSPRITRNVVYPILWGIETDFDALILHGEWRTVDLSDETDSSESHVRMLLKGLYPSMQERIREDLLPIVQGSMRHISEVRARQRPIVEADHREWILGVGEGFDWLQIPNIALIVGPFDPRLDDAIATAALLLASNVEEKRVRINEHNGLVLLVSGAYRQSQGVSPLLAAQQARYLQELAIGVLGQDRFSDILSHMKCVAGTVDMNTRKFTPLLDIQ
ncbi:MAG: hypothetical protein HYT50_01385 [Candidatus Wildermuthbacteria bacterium]|nr:hypothetical protein [Candidatus Wildermuthbacteria bacterium]